MTVSAIKAGRAFVEIFADDAALQRGLKRARKRMQAWSTSVSSAGRSVLRTTLLPATGLALTAKTFADFESAMDRVKALSGATDEEFAALEAQAKSLGKTTVFSASQAAEAMQFFALAGFDVDTIMKAMGPTLDLAAAGQVEIAEAADIAAKVMSGMGIEAEQLGQVTDVLAKAMTTANTDILMLGDAFKFVGPIAKSAGISIEEITAAIQLLSNAGIQGEMAGTTLRGMILALTSPSAEAAKMLKTLRVEVKDAKGDFRGLAPIIGDLERSLDGVGSADKLQALGTIFPARQAAGAAELVSQGAFKLSDATDALGDAAGTAGRIAAEQLDNLKGDATLLMSVLEAVQIAFTEGIAPMLRTIVQGITQAGELLAAFFEKFPGVARVTFAVIAGLVTLGSVLVVTGVGLGLLAAAAAGLSTVIGLLYAGFALLLTPVGTVFAALFALLTPMNLIMVAAAGLGYAILFHTDLGAQALAWLGEQFTWLKDRVMTTWGAIGAALGRGDLQAAANVAMSGVKLTFAEAMAYLQTQYRGFKQGFVEAWYGALLIGKTAMIDFGAFLAKKWIEIRAGFGALFEALKIVAKVSFLKLADLAAQAAIKIKVWTGQMTEEQAKFARKAISTATSVAAGTEAAKAGGILPEAARKVVEEQRLVDVAANAAKTSAEADSNAALSGNTEIADQEQSGIDATLEKARAAFAEAVAAAKGIPATAEDGPDGEGEGKGRGARKRAARRAAEQGDPQYSIEKRNSATAGTFSAFGAAGLGAVTAQDMAAKAAEKGNKLLEDIKKNTQRAADNEPAFGV